MLTNTVILTFVLSGVAFAAGFIDSIAGGGGLLMLPALLLAGLPPQTAIGTNKFTGSLGTTVSVLNFMRSKKVVWKIAGLGLVFIILGAFLGSRLVIILSNLLLGKIIVFLLPFAMLGSLVPHKERPREDPFRGNICLRVPLISLFLGFYDGFFGPGTGSFLILSFHYLLGLDLVESSATAKLFNLAACLGALIVFLLEGKVLFHLGLPLALASIGGHYLGSSLVIKRGAGVVRYFLFASLIILFISLVWKYFLA